jgi:hypothetical protein
MCISNLLIGRFLDAYISSTRQILFQKVNLVIYICLDLIFFSQN